MRKFVAAALAALISPAIAGAAPRDPASDPPTPVTHAPENVRIAMRQETLPPGGKLAEHRQDGERFVFVLSGQLKVSNLVTGDEQVVAAGKMAAEQPGDWYDAEALGADPATFYLIDRAPAAATATVAGGN
jgi:quercetin dioxygenase-like cupin family protein